MNIEIGSVADDKEAVNTISDDQLEVKDICLCQYCGSAKSLMAGQSKCSSCVIIDMNERNMNGD